MIVYSLAKWKEITSKGTSGDQVADILQSWEAQNKMLQWELMQFHAYIEEHGDRKLLAHRRYGELFRKAYNLLASDVTEIELIRGIKNWTPPDLEE